MRVVGFLQNAWSPVYAGGTWPRLSWLAALGRSRSGQRLRVLTKACPAAEFWWDNTTEIVGLTPDSVIAPDYKHILGILRYELPGLVVTCGKQARDAVQQVWNGPLVVLPHPAYRVVTNKLFERAGKYIQTFAVAQDAGGRTVEFRQDRGRVKVIKGAS